jgi:hypothetical protein
VLTSAVLATGLLTETASAQVPAALLGSTVRVAALVAAGRSMAASTAAVVLMKGVMKAMLMKKLRLVVGAAMLAAAIGAIGFASRSGTEARAQSPAQPKGAESDPLVRERGRAVSGEDALRREVEDLRATVRVLLRENHVLQQELEAVRGGPGPAGKGGADTLPRRGRGPQENDPTRPKQEESSTPRDNDLRRGDDPTRPQQNADFARQSREAKTKLDWETIRMTGLGMAEVSQDVEAALKSLRDGKNQEGLRQLEEAVQKMRGEIGQEGRREGVKP